MSAAAGAVGMAAGQFAKIVGARVIGIAGGQEKCKFLVDNAGFDAALDYRCNLADQLRKTCPDGIDFYFENVGGEVQRTVFSHMNTLGRIAICGQIAQYSGAGEPGGPNLMNVVLKSLSIRGFLSVQDYPELFEKFEKDVRQWLLEGRATNHVTITQGLENASSAINNLVTGRNIGKQLLQVAPEPS